MNSDISSDIYSIDQLLPGEYLLIYQKRFFWLEATSMIGLPPLWHLDLRRYYKQSENP